MAQIWKVSLLGRIGTVILFVAVGAFALVLAGPAVGAVTLVLAAAAVWLFALWPAIILTETEVIVRNPWGRRRVPLGDVAGVDGGYAGLSIRRHSGGTITAWAVQKSNAATWSGKATRADEVAAAVERASVLLRHR